MSADPNRDSPEPRADAHRALDAVPDERVSTALALLRQLADDPGAEQPRRQFRTVGVFDGEPDLGRRAKEIAWRELGGGKAAKTA